MALGKEGGGEDSEMNCPCEVSGDAAKPEKAGCMISCKMDCKCAEGFVHGRAQVVGD